MKILVTLSLIGLIAGNTFSQQLKSKPNENVQSIYKRVRTYTDSLFLRSVHFNKCSSGYVFIRFTTNDRNKIIKVETNKNTPLFLDTIFRKMLLNYVVSVQKSVKKTYILPVMYDFHDGCIVDTSTKRYTALEWQLKSVPDLAELQTATAKAKEGNFLNMTNFDDDDSLPGNKIYPLINCLLLTPFKLTTPSY